MNRAVKPTEHAWHHFPRPPGLPEKPTEYAWRHLPRLPGLPEKPTEHACHHLPRPPGLSSQRQIADGSSPWWTAARARLLRLHEHGITVSMRYTTTGFTGREAVLAQKQATIARGMTCGAGNGRYGCPRPLRLDACVHLDAIRRRLRSHGIWRGRSARRGSRWG